MTMMSEASLLAFIAQQESTSQRPEVAAEQAKAMDFYLGKPMGTEEEGRSSVHSSDVWDVVEGLAPLVLKPFVSSDDVVRFQPVGPEDVDAAEQETDYINFVVTQRNDVFEQLVAWVKAGLLQKNGVVKYWWDDTRRTSLETYRGKSGDEFAALMADLQQSGDVKILSHSETPGPMVMDEATGQMVQGEPLHDFKVRITRNTGQAKYAVVPPEELRVSKSARSPNPKLAPFIEHITRKTISELREMGYDVPDDINDASTSAPDSEPQAVARAFDSQALTSHDGHGDPSMREVWYREAYAYVDFDGDGIAEPRQICLVGDTILNNEEVEEWPFAGWTPYLQLFQYDGRCPADESIEIQLIKTTLLRQSLDNIYTINNNRTFVGEGVNLDDMLDNQIAGIVRVKGDVVGNQAMSMPVTPIGGIIQPMIEYMDSAKENRTGFTRYNQGTDSNSLNKTATGVRIIAEAGNERVSLVSRSFAEMGLKPLMIGLHRLCRANATKAETVQLRGKWVDIDPRQWSSRYDMTVSVGLGTADRQMQMQGQQMLMGEQAKLMQVPGLVTPKNLYASAAKFAELLGEKDASKYFSDPAQAEAPPPPDPMDDPKIMLEVTKAKQRDRELDQKDRELDIRDRDSQIKALADHARLEAELAGMIPGDQVFARIDGIESQMGAIQTKGTKDVLTDDATQGEAMPEQSETMAEPNEMHPEPMEPYGPA